LGIGIMPEGAARPFVAAMQLRLVRLRISAIVDARFRLIADGVSG
jgi:hypothetical protein